MSKLREAVRSAVLIAAMLCAGAGESAAQSNPGLVYGQVPSAAQWNSYFAGKVDYPIGQFTTSAPGLVPASLGLGSTYFLAADGVFRIPAGGSALPGGSPGQVQFNNTGVFGGFTVGGDATLNTGTGALTVTKSNGVAFGSAAFAAVGTSGATVGLLNGGLTFGGADTFTQAPTITALAGGGTQCVQVSNAGLIGVTGTPCGSGGGAVSSVFTRTGAVTAQSGDYSFSLLSGSAACGQLPALTGDTTTIAGNCATTTAKVNGVAYGASPSTNTVPVVTGPNAVTYEAVPNAALANSSLTIAGHSVALGGSQAIAFGDLTGSIALSQLGSSYTNGQLLIGSTTDGFLHAGTLTAGLNITITNSPGGITIAAAGGGGGCSTSGTADNALSDNGAGGCSSDAAANFSAGTLTLGTAGSVVGGVALHNATSGAITLAPVAGALGSVTATLQAATDTIVERATTDTLLNKTISGASNTLSNIANASLTNSSITFGATAVSLGSTVSALNAVNIGPSTAGTGAFTTLSASSTVSGAGITSLFASPPAIGGTAAAAGSFTTLMATGSITYAGTLTSTANNTTTNDGARGAMAGTCAVFGCGANSTALTSYAYTFADTAASNSTVGLTAFSGSTTNVSLKLMAQGTGKIVLGSALSSANGLLFSGLSTGTQVACLGLDSGNNVVLNAAACGSGGGGAVSSVFTRTGAVTAQTGDYTISQITNGQQGPLTGDVTTSGAAATLASTAVTPGSYTSANITVDAKGRITAASNGSGGSGVSGPGSSVNTDLATWNGTGGNTLADGGITVGSVVKATSPGAGVAHFAGSTQAVTSSAVALADMATIASPSLLGNGSGSTAIPAVLTPGVNFCATATTVDVCSPIEAAVTGSAYTLLVTDMGKTVPLGTGVTGFTIPSGAPASFLKSGQSFAVQNISASAIPVTNSSTGPMPSFPASLPNIPAGWSAFFSSDGTSIYATYSPPGAVTGTGSIVLATSPTLVTPALGTPSALVLTNATALPAAQVSSGALANGMTAATQAANSNDTKLATDAYVDRTTTRSATVGWIATVNPLSAPLIVFPANSTLTSLVGNVETATGGTATVSVNVASSGTVCGSGTTVHSGSMNANGTAATNQTLTLTTTAVTAGQRLCLVTTGTTTWTGGTGIGAITVSYTTP